MCDRSRRSAPLVAAAAALGALELLVRALDVGARVPVVAADFGATAIVAGIVAGLQFLGGLFKGKVDGNVKLALEGVRSVVADLGKKIVEGLTVVAWQFARLWDWLKKHLSRIAREIYDVIAAIVQRVTRVLDKILGPVIDFLDKVRANLLQIYRDYIRPILDIIEFIRLPLRILSAFGVEWAKRLDATLGNLEDWITDNFRFVLGKVNHAIDVLNGIVDVTGLLKRFALTRSLLRDINIWMGLAWWKAHRPLQEATRDDYLRPLPTALADARAGQLDEYVRTRGGELAPVIDEAIADAFLIARDVSSGL